MSIISRAIPGLFGGVSQQIPAMRHQTQGEVQENGLSTVVQGLFKRPGAKHIAELPNQWAAGASEASIGNVHCHVIDRGEGSRWQLAIGESTLNVVNMATGVSETVAFQNISGGTTGFPSYLVAADPQTAFRCITVADTTFLVNTEKTVASLNTDGTAFPINTGYLYVKSAVPQHTFTATVNGVACSYTSGTTTTVAVIATGLRDAINAAGFGFSAALVSGVVGLLQVDLGAITRTLTATDTYGNTTMIVLTNGVQKYSDLPPSFQIGERLKIIGTSVGVGTDPYYVTWSGTQWVETRAYNIHNDIDASTMPYRIYKEGGIWKVRPTAWAKRLVGDGVTNPMPSFVGRKLRDIFFYRNRLGFLAGDSVILSKAGDYFNFFSSTATDVLDSDPIDLGGSAEAVDTLDWAVPFTQQLIIWASTKQQFSLVAGDILSPATARLVPVTAFESVNTARPKQLGNRIVFPSTSNGYTQLSLYRVSQDTVSNTAEPLSDHVPSYIPLAPRNIEMSETAKVLALVPPGRSSELYVFKYEDDGEKLTQRAWQKFTFKGGIIKTHWAGQLLYLTVLYRDSSSALGHRLCLEAIDFSQTAVDPGISYGLRLDRRVFVNGATATGTFGEVQFTATMPYSSDLEVYHYASGSDPVKLVINSVTVDAGAPTTLTFKVQAPATTGTFVVGQPYTFRYTFTEVFMRDADGVPIMDARLKLLKMLVRFVKTGYFKALVTTKALGSYLYTFGGQGVGLPGQLLGVGSVLTKGDFNIPVHAQAEDTTITLESASHLPCCFPYAEWRGNVNLKSKR